MTTEQLTEQILLEIDKVKRKIGTTFSSDISDATNRVAISNLYIALSNLQK